ncbi:MAG: hypothetical protein M1819_002613 [Sarea resinae]|nr:MAG: hypothetical protein M1819_002613 [Sarea resinae]
MGRELQKKKNRSSIPKVRRKPKSKKLNVLGNPIIAANWRQNETLSQNYRRLGLTAKLNRSTGGIEKDPATASATAPAPSDALTISSAFPSTLTPGTARIERDPTTGAILRVIHDSPPPNPNPLNDPLNDVTEDTDVIVNRTSDGAIGAASAPTGIVAELERQARKGVRKAPRKQSAREEEWVERLVEKYGDDFGKMVRDRKLNPMQQAEGDLKRRVARWKKTKAGRKVEGEMDVDDDAAA